MYFPSLATSTLITFPSSVFNELMSCQSSALQILTVWSNPDDARYSPLFDMLEGFALSSLSPFMSTSSFAGLLVPFVNCISSCERNQRTSDTEDLCAGILYDTFRARRSHIRMESSPDPAATWYLERSNVRRLLSEIGKRVLTHLERNPMIGSRVYAHPRPWPSDQCAHPRLVQSRRNRCKELS